MNGIGRRALAGPLLILSAGAGVVLYAGLAPPAGGAPAAAGPALPPAPAALAALPGDLPAYLWRFLLSFLLLGALPLAGALLCGERPAGLGLATPRRARPGGTFRPWMLLPLLAAGAGLGLISAFWPDDLSLYPYSQTLARWMAAGRWDLFPAHAALYLLFYYLPWELLFRGVLIFPLVRLAGEGGRLPGELNGRLGPILRHPALLALASLQAVPSALLHFGHPLSESLFALPFGVMVGVLALWTGSILPGLVLHAGIGIFLDLFLVLRSAGALS